MKYLFCTLCGHQVDDSAKFCDACGNNLQQPTQSLNSPQIQQQSPVQHKEVEFIVEQKILSLRPVYRVKDVYGNVFMEIKKDWTSFFSPALHVNSPDGKPIGHIQGNFLKTNWQLIDAQGQVQATLHFPLFMVFNKHFDLETPHGWYNSGNTFWAYKFECYDPNGQISFLVDKKILSIRDSFKIQSFGTLSPFITALSAICIDMRFFPDK